LEPKKRRRQDLFTFGKNIYFLICFLKSQFLFLLRLWFRNLSDTRFFNGPPTRENLENYTLTDAIVQE
jgi:hypothetical protein